MFGGHGLQLHQECRAINQTQNPHPAPETKTRIMVDKSDENLCKCLTSFQNKEAFSLEVKLLASRFQIFTGKGELDFSVVAQLHTAVPSSTQR